VKMETWAAIRHLFYIEKLPKKAIARKLGLDPKTVRRALKRETFSPAVIQPRTSKLDPYKEKTKELLNRYSDLSAVRLHEEIQKLGYPGGISILRDYLATFRTPSKVFLPIRTTPAEEAQADWAYIGTVASQRVYCFLMVLSFSGMLYLQFFPSQTLEHFMTGHLRAFHFFQGVPKKIRYDNLLSVVLSRFGSAIQFNPRFLAFAAHYLFDPSPCNVKSPHEKGRVERIIRYVKNNFLAGRTFPSVSDINQQGFTWRDKVANTRIHGTTGKKPIDLFDQQEKSLLTPLPKTDYDTRLTLAVKSTSQSLAKFETNRYSVPFAYASRMLTLKADDQWVSLYDKEKLIAQHQRSQQKYQSIEDPRHYQGLLSSKPHGAYFKHRDALLTLGETAHHYVELLTKTELRLPHQIQKIIQLVELYGKTEVLAAMEHALPYNALGHEYLRNIIQANRRKRTATQPLGSPSSKINPDLIRSTWVEERDPSLYDSHFQTQEVDDHEDPET
jgi:transposase